MSTSYFQPTRLLDPDCCYKFTYSVANSADDLDLHCLQRQDISGFSRTRVKSTTYSTKKLPFRVSSHIWTNDCLENLANLNLAYSMLMTNSVDENVIFFLIFAENR